MTDQPVRHTADTITDDELDALYVRIATLEHVAERNKQAYKLVVRDIQAATQLLQDGKAALRQAKLDQLTDREAISYWTHQTQLAREYSQHDNQALAATVVQARRWAGRAKQAEAAIARVRETAACWEQMPSDRHVYIHEAARALRVALNEPKEQ
ncbi:hypothetical protein [Streptomyces virginiae]|uniref:hypothetical protein n=1 Tax=Streptomyces virginiae TaxID=1961 RepID=UPI00364F62D9